MQHFINGFIKVLLIPIKPNVLEFFGIIIGLLFYISIAILLIILFSIILEQIRG